MRAGVTWGSATRHYGKVALRYARRFRSEGLQPGEVVILIQQHGEELVFAFWGAVISGLIPSIMPFLTEKLSPEQYRNDLRALIGVTRPAAIVTYPEFEALVKLSLVADSSVSLVISTASIREAGDVFGLDEADRLHSEADVVLLQHSSGTTGLQKGVALSHRAVANQLGAYGTALALSDADVVVSWLPLYHDMGLIAGFLLPILCGANSWC